MKTRRWLITILILAILAVYVFLGTSYLGQHRQNNNLTAGLSGLKELLAALPVIPTDLDQRLAAAQAALTGEESTFTGETNDILIVNAILRLAETTGVKGIPLSTQPWTIEQISNLNFSVFHMSMQITGDFPHTQDFLKRLESGELNTLAFTYLRVVRTPVDFTANTTAADSTANMTLADTSTKVISDLNIAVYTLAPGG